MVLSDIIGSIGVAMMLAAFILNIADKLDNNDLFYIVLNLFGGILACIASCMISYEPFIILESTWSIASAWALYTNLKEKHGERRKNTN